jgi:hypothetical protein
MKHASFKNIIPHVLESRGFSFGAILFSMSVWLAPFFLFYNQWIWLPFDTGRELALVAALRDGSRLYTDYITWYGPVTYETAAAFSRIIPLGIIPALHVFQLMVAGALSFSLALAAKRSGVPKGIAWLLPGLYASISAVNLDGTSFLMPYSLAATFGLMLLSALYVAFDGAKRTNNAVWVILTALLAGLLAATKQDFLPALGGTFIVFAFYKLLTKRAIISPVQDLALAVSAITVFASVLYLSTGFSGALIYENLLIPSALKAFYPKGSLYEMARGYSFSMASYFLVSTAIWLLLFKAGKVWQTVLPAIGVMVALFIFPGLIKAVFYWSPWIFLVCFALTWWRSKSFPEPDLLLFASLLQIFMHLRQGNMNELNQVGGVLIFAGLLFRGPLSEAMLTIRKLAMLLLVFAVVIPRLWQLPHRLNEKSPVTTVSGVEGSLTVESKKAEVINQALKELQNRSGKSMAFGQEAGWLAVLAGVKPEQRYLQWWAFNEAEVLTDLEKRKPEVLILTYYNNRPSLSFFSNMNQLTAFIPQNYTLGWRSGTDSGFTIEIWDVSR